ncbi:MAG TPA: hypothetical protein VLX91_14890 [Candidatus Acidoferrales bacterium]|nr:hypothetical protein [Candidatus Acidoferrales bacterium]
MKTLFLHGLLILSGICVGIAIAGCNSLGSKGHNSIPESATYEYWITGGAAGTSQHTTIDSTGSAELDYKFVNGSNQSSYMYQLTSSEFDTFKAAFRSLNLFSLADAYPASQQIANGYSYKITCRFDGTSKTVTTEDNASIPRPLSLFLPVMSRTNSMIKFKQ